MSGKERTDESAEWERHRHECEVRRILSLPSMHAMAEYLKGSEKHRGKAAVDKLRDEVRAILRERQRERRGGL